MVNIKPTEIDSVSDEKLLAEYKYLLSLSRGFQDPFAAFMRDELRRREAQRFETASLNATKSVEKLTKAITWLTAGNLVLVGVSVLVALGD